MTAFSKSLWQSNLLPVVCKIVQRLWKTVRHTSVAEGAKKRLMSAVRHSVCSRELFSGFKWHNPTEIPIKTCIKKKIKHIYILENCCQQWQPVTVNFSSFQLFIKSGCCSVELLLSRVCACDFLLQSTRLFLNQKPRELNAVLLSRKYQGSNGTCDLFSDTTSQAVFPAFPVAFSPTTCLFANLYLCGRLCSMAGNPAADLADKNAGTSWRLRDEMSLFLKTKHEV